MQGREAAVNLAEEAGHTVAGMEQMRLMVNLDKSGVKGSDTRLTAAMRAVAGPQLAGDKVLKDLGVIQGAGAAETEPWPGCQRHATDWHALHGLQCQ